MNPFRAHLIMDIGNSSHRIPPVRVEANVFLSSLCPALKRIIIIGKLVLIVLELNIPRRKRQARMNKIEVDEYFEGSGANIVSPLVCLAASESPASYILKTALVEKYAHAFQNDTHLVPVGPNGSGSDRLYTV